MSQTKYLAKYAEPEWRLVEKWNGEWDAAVALPLVDESERFGDLLTSLSAAAQKSDKHVLAIIVVNARPDHPPAVRTGNAQTLRRLGSRGEELFFSRHSKWLELAVFDRTSPGREFPVGEGVGLARKLGCDLALGLRACGKLRSDLVSTTDGDVRVGEDYFQVGEAPSVTWGIGSLPVAAYAHPYAHHFDPQGDPIGARALTLYEIYLRYYVEGLRLAGSPYAFPTIGSTLTIHLDAYAQVRGFPKLLAAEDFYILSKLSTVGKIHIPRGARITIAQRPSDRVPFGTGKSMEKIGQILREENPYQLYHPHIFRLLGETLRALDGFADHRDADRVKEAIARADATWGNTLVELLESLGTFRAIEIAGRTRKHAPDIRRHLQTWFDAFKTLKFTHGLRDRGLSNVPYAEAARHFIDGKSDREILEGLRQSAERAGGWAGGY